MGHIACELCGSADLIKQDGAFVCQSCGCKYSLEEVKKLMNQESTAIQTTVNTDLSFEYVNLKKAIYEAMLDGRFDSAYSNSVRLLASNPDDPEMIAVQALVILGREKMAFDIPSSTTNGMNRFYSMVSNWQEKYSKQVEILSHVKDYVASACKVQRMFLKEEISNLEAQIIKTTAGDTLMSIGNVLGMLGGNLLSAGLGMNDDREGRQRDAHNQVIATQIQKVQDKERKLDDFENLQNRKLDPALRDAKKADAEYREQRKLAYWEKHAEQKSKLESRIKQLQEERQPFLNKIEAKEQQIKQMKDSAYPLSQKSKALKAEIDRLNRQLDFLGVFKIKEKRQIRERIESLRKQIPSFSEISEEIKAFKEQLEAQSKENQEEIRMLQKNADQLYEQIKSLQKELNMDR